MTPGVCLWDVADAGAGQRIKYMTVVGKGQLFTKQFKKTKFKLALPGLGEGIFVKVGG